MAPSTPHLLMVLCSWLLSLSTSSRALEERLHSVVTMKSTTPAAVSTSVQSMRAAEEVLHCARMSECRVHSGPSYLEDGEE